MADKDSTLALVRDLASAGVSKASFSESGSLLNVEFFESLAALGPTLPEQKDPPKAPVDPVEFAAMRLSGQRAPE